MKTFEEFTAHFETNIKPTLEELENKRKQVYRKRLELGGGAAGVVFLNLIMTYFGALHPYTVFFTALFAPFVAYTIFKYHYNDTTIPAQYKETVVKAMLNFLDESLTYDPSSYVKEERFAASELFPLRPDYYTGDDLIKGNIEGIPIELSEVLAEYEPLTPIRWGLRQPKKKTIFHGIFLVATYDKSFQGKIFIFPDKLQRYMGYGGMLVQQHNVVRGKYIKPRNMEFRELFSVYAENEYEGEKLLTDSLMEKLLHLRKKTHAPVYCAIKEQNIYIGIDLRREIFEIDVKKSLLKPQIIRNFYDEVFYIIEIINILKLEELSLAGILGVPKDGLKDVTIPTWEMKVLQYILKVGNYLQKKGKK